MSALSRTQQTAVLLGIGLMLLGAGMAHSQSSGGAYELRAHALDSGGRSSGGIYSVHGVIGQAANSTSSAGVYSITAGLLHQRPALPDAVFSNGFESP